MDKGEGSSLELKTVSPIPPLGAVSNRGIYCSSIPLTYIPLGLP
jgi:hypothetical protein